MVRPLRAWRELVKNLFRKHNTGQYPHTKPVIDDKFRGRILFDAKKCIGCNICVRNCPADAIKITQVNQDEKPTEVDGKQVPAKRKFKCVIDLSKCIYCGQCTDGCPVKALSSSQEFELAHFDKKELLDETKNPYEDKK